MAADSFDTTTLLGSHLNLSTLLPVDFNTFKECTLNTYFNVFPNESFNTTPKLQYFGIGNRGCYNVDDEILTSAYNPARTNMNLYNLLPIRCRPVDEDLTDAERASYRMRVRKTLQDGNDYFLYYLKVMEYVDGIKFKRFNPITGKEEPYELNTENLEPKPQKPKTSTIVTAEDTSVIAYCTANITIEAKEVLEYIRIAYEGDTRYARISEAGFFTGVDKTVNGTSGQGAPITYKESIYTMLYNHHTWTGHSLTREEFAFKSQFDITSNGSISEK